MDRHIQYGKSNVCLAGYVLKNDKWSTSAIYKFYGLIWGILFLLIVPWQVMGQTEGDETESEENLIQRNLEISGQMGAFGQLYGISGRSRRRPQSTGRLFLRPTITFLNEITLNVDVLLSNEGISARQNINQIGINPSWSWGDAHAGDFSETFSNFTLSGITIRGGGVNLYPGKFRFSAVAGRSRRAVSGGSVNKSYSRTVYGAKLGVGEESGSFIDLIVFRAKDDVGSLPPDSLLTNPGAIYSDTTDTMLVGNAPPANPYAVTPQENLVSGLNWQLEVVPEYLTWSSEVTGSIFTRDLRSEKIEYNNLNIPSFAGFSEDLYSARNSTNADFAAQTNLSANFSRVNISAGYKWIGPGFRSLGTSYMMNDQQEINSRISARISRTSISLNWARLNDNLLNQKENTAVQNRFGGNLNVRISNVWNSSISSSFMTKDNHSDNDTTRTQFDNMTFNTNQSFTFMEHPAFNNFSVSYSFQQSEINAGLQPENSNRNHTVNSNVSLRLLENLNSNVSFGFVSNSSSNMNTRSTYTVGAGFSHNAFENKLNSSLRVTSSFRSQNVSIRGRLNSSYRLTDKDQISLSLSLTDFEQHRMQQDNFQEFIGSLRITHQF